MGRKLRRYKKITGRHPSTICELLKSEGIETKNHLKLSVEDIDCIAKLYLQGLTINDIHKLFEHKGITQGAINFHLRKMKITRKNGKQAKLSRWKHHKIQKIREWLFTYFKVRTDGFR